MPFCPKCGNETSEEFNACPKCGQILKTSYAPSVTIGTKNSGVAAIFSLLIPGIGQVYAGKIGRGLLILFFVLPLSGLFAFFFFWMLFPLFLPLALWIWNVYDAYILCEEYNNQLLRVGRPPW